MENKVSVSNEVLDSKLDGLDEKLARVERTIEGFSTNYVSDQVFQLRIREVDLMGKQLELRIQALDVRIQDLEKRRNIPVFMTALVTALLTAAFTYLLYARIQGGK